MTCSSTDDAGACAPRRTVWVGVCLLVTVAVSCGPSFDPPWRVTDFRLLGIRATPVAVEPGESATLRALVHAPNGEPEYSWSWCPVETSAQQRYECPLDELAERADAGRRRADAGGGDTGGAPGGGGSLPVDPALFDLGDGETASLPYPGDRESVYDFCRSIQRAVSGASGGGLAGSETVSDCASGYDVSIRLVVESGDRRIEAKKKVTLATRSEEPNRNPTHDGIELRVADPDDVAKVHGRVESFPPASVPRREQWVEVTDDGPDRLVAGVPYQVRALVESDSAESYRPPIPRGSDEPPERRRERLSFEWFVTDGDLEQNQRLFVPDTQSIDKARRTVWIAPDGCENERGSCETTIWSVVRDGRLGVAWAEASLELDTND